MTEDTRGSDGDQSDTFREANRGSLTRRAALGLGGAAGVAGVLAWVIGPEIPDAGELTELLDVEDQEPSETGGTEKPSLWSQEIEAIQQASVNRPTLRPTFEYEPVSVQADSAEDTQISAIAAAPADAVSGDRVILRVVGSAVSSLETLLVARFTTGDRVTSREIGVGDTTISFGVFRRSDLWMGIARHDAPDLEGEAELLVARANSHEDLQSVIDAFSDRYASLRPV